MLGAEQMTVTAVDTFLQTLTVIRGVNGTTAVDHSYPNDNLIYRLDAGVMGNTGSEQGTSAFAEMMAAESLEMGAGIRRPSGLIGALGSAEASPGRSWPCRAAPWPR